MISMTPVALAHLRQLLVERRAAPGEGLRLRVERGGCAGMQYVMKVDAPATGDTIVTQEDVRLIIDQESLSFVADSQVDYTEDLADSGFKVINPRAARSCGCGNSFEPLSN